MKDRCHRWLLLDLAVWEDSCLGVSGSRTSSAASPVLPNPFPGGARKLWLVRGAKWTKKT